MKKMIIILICILYKQILWPQINIYLSLDIQISSWSQMRMLCQASRFGMKNFYKQLGLSQHFTVRGAIHRFQRQNPRIFKITKFLLAFSCVTSMSAALLPGTSLPFQQSYKKFLLQKYSQINERTLGISKLWYLKSGNPDPLAYLFIVYNLITYLIENGMDSGDNLATYVQQANQVMIHDKKPNNVKDIVRIENICNCVHLLQKIIQKFQISKDSTVLSNQKLLEQISTLVDCSVLGIKGQVSEIDKKSYASSLKIFEYLLKFSGNRKSVEILQKMVSLLSDPTKKFMSEALIQQQDLKNQLKRIYQTQPQNKDLILQILQIVQKQRITP